MYRTNESITARIAQSRPGEIILSAASAPTLARWQRLGATIGVRLIAGPSVIGDKKRPYRIQRVRAES